MTSSVIDFLVLSKGELEQLQKHDIIAFKVMSESKITILSHSGICDPYIIVQFSKLVSMPCHTYINNKPLCEETYSGMMTCRDYLKVHFFGSFCQ